MGPAIIAGITAATAAATTGASVAQAQQRNKQLEQQREAERRAAAQQQDQQEAAMEQERRARIDEARRARGTIVAAVGPAGLPQLDASLVAGLEEDLDLTRTNYAYTSQSVRSQALARDSALQGQKVNTGLSGVTGLFSGVSTGLSIGQGVANLGKKG